MNIVVPEFYGLLLVAAETQVLARYPDGYLLVGYNRIMALITLLLQEGGVSVWSQKTPTVRSMSAMACDAVHFFCC